MSQINVGINFTANTQSAKAQIESLANTLQSIASTEVKVEGGGISAAVKSAEQLGVALEKAFNTSTNKLDFSKFQAELKKSGTTISEVGSNLLSLGPKGQQAFNQLATAIGQAEAPTRRLNSALVSFGNTLLNTIKWQAASSLIHGFMSTVNSAVGYIENLDKSLNAIQIVTQKSNDQMEIFANSAKAAASRLSSTAKEYSDAALIFFQQGLNGGEVEERVEATIKLAKVTGESVSAVSDQLTAIWNNFDDGTVNLEHYADVITALGAATASSSNEIAEGLSKFAAVADTVGLSYEKAAASVATVVAETRQSADIVGTAFKTIFARIEGLNLGETLEDGVTLNKYSAALEKIGVNILDANGQVKDMDTILDRLGDRWDKIGEAEKIAVAETVAGTRQYNQFLALMENYDKIQANEDLAKNSDGTLDKQFETYQGGIEALKTELQKAKEDVFDKLLDKEMITKIMETIKFVYGFVEKIVKAMGGIKGIVLMLGGRLLSAYMPQISQGIGNFALRLKDTFGFTARESAKELANFRNMADEAARIAKERAKANMSKNGFSSSAEVSAQSTSIDILRQSSDYRKQILMIQEKLAKQSGYLTEEQKKQLQLEIDTLSKKQKQLDTLKEELDKATKLTAEARKRAEKIQTKQDYSQGYTKQLGLKKEVKSNNEEAATKKQENQGLIDKLNAGRGEGGDQFKQYEIAREQATKKMDEEMASLKELRASYSELSKEQQAEKQEEIDALDAKIKKLQDYKTAIEDAKSKHQGTGKILASYLEDKNQEIQQETDEANFEVYQQSDANKQNVENYERHKQQLETVQSSGPTTGSHYEVIDEVKEEVATDIADVDEKTTQNSEQLTSKKNELEALQAEQTSLTDQADIEANEQAQKALQEEIDLLEKEGALLQEKRENLEEIQKALNGEQGSSMSQTSAAETYLSGKIDSDEAAITDTFNSTRAVDAGKAAVAAAAPIETTELTQTLDQTAGELDGADDSGLASAVTARVQSILAAVAQGVDSEGGEAQEGEAPIEGNPDAGGFVVPEASIANMQALAEEQGRLTAQAEEFESINGQIAASLGKVGTAQKKNQGSAKESLQLSKEQLKELKSQEPQLNRLLQLNSKQVKEIAKTDTEMGKFVKSLIKADGSAAKIDFSKMSPKDVQKVIQLVDQLGNSARDTARYIGGAADSMGHDISAASNSPKEMQANLDEMAASAREAGAAEEEAGNQGANFGKNEEKVANFGQTIKDVGQGFTDLVGGVSQGAMGVQMFQGSLDQLTDSMVNGGTLTEKLMASVGMLSGAMQVAQGVETAWNAVKTITSALSKKSLVERLKETVAETSNTGAKWLNVAATVALKIAESGWAGLVLGGLLLAAIGVATVAIVKNSKAKKEATKNTQDLAESDSQAAKSANEKAKADREALNEQTKLNNEYRNALKLYEETGEGKADLVDAAQKVADSMDIENANLLIMQGNYAALNAEIEKNLALKGQQAVQSSKGAFAAASASAVSTAAAKEGGIQKLNVVNGDGQITGSTIFFPITDETERGYLSEYLAENPQDGWWLSGYGLQLESGNKKNAGAITELYNGFLAWVQEKYKDFDIGNSQFAQAYNEASENGELDTLNEITSAYQGQAEAAATDAMNTTGIKNVTTQSDYNKTHDEYMRKVFSDMGLDYDNARDREKNQDLIESAENALLEDETLGSYERTRRATEEVKATSREGKQFLEKGGLQSWAEEHGYTEDEALQAFLLIDFNAIDAEHTIEDAMDTAQKIADARTIKVKYQAIEDAKSGLKENMSADDWSEWFANNEDAVFEDGAIVLGDGSTVSKAEFMGMSTDEQQAVLDSSQSRYDTVAATKQEIEGLEEQQADLEEMGEEGYVSNYMANHGLSDVSLSELRGKGLVNEEGYSRYIGHLYQMGLSEEEIQDKTQSAQNLMINAGLATRNANGTFTVNKSVDDVRGEAVAAYNQDVESTNTQLESAREQQLIDNRVAYEQEAEAAGMSYEAYKNYVGVVAESVDRGEESEEVARRIIKENGIMNTGLKNLTDHWEDYGAALKSGKKDSAEYQNALAAIRQDTEKMLTLDPGTLSEGFFESAENLALIEKAANGDAAAIDQLRINAAKDITLHIGVEDDDIGSLRNDVSSAIDDLGDVDVPIGTTFDDSNLIDGLYDAAVAAGATTDEIQELFDGLGWDPEFETETYTLNDDDIAKGYIEAPGGFNEDGTPIMRQIPIETSMVSGSTIEIPKIRGKDKHITATYKGRATSTANTNKSGGGGGGGGGGGDKKKASEEKDRYHEVTKKLDDLGQAYDRLGKHKDHAFGKSYINIIKEETEALDEQINTLNSKLKEAEGYYKEDLAAIQKYGAIIDENGNITNYNAIIEKYVGLFNAGSIDEDAYSEMKEALDRFEETADTLEEIKDEIEDKVYEQVALEIERIDTEVNMNIEINDEDLQWLEYLLTKIENQSFNTAKQIAIMGYQTDEVFSKINTYEAGLKSLEEQAAQNLANGLFTETGGWDSSMKDKAKSFTDGLMEANKTLLEYKQTLTEKFQEAIDEVNETFDNQIGRFANYTSILESYTEILHLTGKTLKNSDLIIKFGNQQVEVAKNQLIALKAQQNTLYASLAEAQQKLADAQARGDQDAIRHWTDEVNNITIQAEEGKANLISSFQEAMSTAADIFTSTVEQFIAQANAALSIYDTLAEAQDAYGRAKERSKWFLDNAAQAYELSKLMRKINQQIDQTDNLGAQIKLRDILDEINDIKKNNVKISQDDLDVLNAKYELRLAEIALEEAQNAKDTVKLSRNAEGGWGYVYTANQDTTDKAIQDYEDKAYNLEKLIKEKITNISDAILENKQDTLDRIASLNIESFENEQDYWDAVNKIREEGLAKDLYLRDSLERMLAEGNLSYADILLKDFENVDSLEEGRSIFEQVTQELLDNASNAFAEYKKQTDGLLESLGFDSTEDLLAWLQSSADDIVNGANGLSSKLIQYSKESQDAIKKAADAIEDYEKQYNESINNMIDTSDDMIKTITEMLRRFGLLDDSATLADFWNGDIADDYSTPAQYDTGGYTGEWGQAGKLAVLHEKELVLNKNETKDLLRIMDIIKDQALKDRIKEASDLLEISRNSINNLFKAMGNNELEQNVHITAEFPSVTDHNEIEEAFNNLINSASQYINRY